MAAPTVKINFVGDLCLFNIDPTSFQLDDSLRELFATADLNVANLECVLTDSESRAPHHPIHLKSDPRASPILDLMHVFSLANNHIMDYGAKGLEDTIALLQSWGKGYFGAGPTQHAASAPLSIEVGGRKIAFIGSSRWYVAAARRAGTASDNHRELERLTARAKSSGHFVVVMPHWNYEYIHYPAPDNRKLARRLVAAGADVIVGAHPHVVQGYEQYRGKHIFHSLGNFVFSSRVFKDIRLGIYPEPPQLQESCILSLTIGDADQYHCQVTPILTGDHGIHRMTGAARDRFLARLETISRTLLDDGVHRRVFYQQARHVSRKSSRTLRDVASRQGLWSMAVLLAGLRKQDLKILMHTLVHRG